MENQFFVRVSNTYVAKNKAYASALELSRKMHGTLITGEYNLNNFIERLRIAIARINKENPRCQPIHIRIRIFNEPSSIKTEQLNSIYVYNIGFELEILPVRSYDPGIQLEILEA